MAKRGQLHNPLTMEEKGQLKGWANAQYAIAMRYKSVDTPRSEFYHGRSVAAGKIASTYNPLYRKASFGDWILLGKLHVTGAFCWVCRSMVRGEQLVYTNTKTKKNVVVCSKCVEKFEKQEANPITQKRYERFIELAWKAWDRYELVDDPNSKEGTRRYQYYMSLKRSVESMSNQFHPSSRPKLPNPTLVMPIKSKEQLGHLFNAQSQLAKAGVRFDSGTSVGKGKLGAREWELDWSLRGGYMRNPIRHTKQGWYWGSVGPQPTKKKLLAQVRAIYVGGYKDRNPRTATHVAVWYDRQTRSWVIQKKDRYGNQVGEADYVYTKQEALLLKKEYLGEMKKKSTINPLDLYRGFHGNPPKGTRKVFYEAPKGELIKIGRLANIEYIPEPPSKYTGTRFTHEAGDLGHKIIKSNAILATNNQGTQLYIVKETKSKYPKFSERGILG